ncbi:hypothetical protein ACFY2K_42355 [Kitasatospora sp. NPDC001309]|uniref:hypothetical protein n=1 Tax=Kitasatospora sp. NPDC001309 TaxID=3364013 RepID=UPI003698EDCB
MSDTLASAQAAAAVDAPIQPPAAPAPAPSGGRRNAEPRLGHTRGGLPAVPLAVTTANSVVGLASAAALISGPVVALAATAGTVATSAIATRVARRAAAKAAQRAAGTTRGTASGQRAAHLSLVKSPAQQRGSNSASGPGRGRTPTGTAGRTGNGRVGVPRQSPTGSAGGGSSAHPGATSLRSPGGTAGRNSVGPVPSGPRGSGARRGGGGGSAPGKSPGAGKAALDRVAARAGAVKAVRAADRKSMPTRSERRSGQSEARRQVADARRDAKAAERDRKAAQHSPLRRAAAKPAAALRRTLDRARGKARTAADQSTERKVTDARREARKAPARREARNRLRRSAARFHGRRLLAALLALPVGLLGMVTTPIGRKLGLNWLMHPGRRLYRRLAGKAAQQRAERDTATRQDLADAEQAIDEAIDTDDTGEQAVADTVPRAPKHHQPAHTSSSPSAPGGDMSKTGSGFDFSEVASEMYGSAMNYDPDGMMHVLAAFEAMPEGLESVANTFRVLAERSDEEFPLDKVVGEALNEVYTLLMTAVSAAEEVGKAFRGAHEEDISRHENPRNGEEKWDIVNNQ